MKTHKQIVIALLMDDLTAATSAEERLKIVDRLTDLGMGRKRKAPEKPQPDILAVKPQSSIDVSFLGTKKTEDF